MQWEQTTRAAQHKCEHISPRTGTRAVAKLATELPLLEVCLSLISLVFFASRLSKNKVSYKLTSNKATMAMILP